jgi:hypothetical protein
MGMLQIATQSVPAFLLEALAASKVGAWEYEAAIDCLRCDSIMADLYGLTPEEATNGIPIARINRIIHHDDRGRSRQKRELMLERGGMFVIEYRIVVDDAVRWVLVRGYYGRQAVGEVHGRGIIIDITDSKYGGHVEGEAFFIAADKMTDPLDRAAHHAIEARRAIDQMSKKDNRIMREIVDMLLLIIGRATAKALANNK